RTPAIFCPCPFPHRALHSFPTRRSSDLTPHVERQEVLQTHGGADQTGTDHTPRGAGERERRRPRGRCLWGEGTAARRHHPQQRQDRKSTRLNSSHVSISYAVFCLKKKKT